MRKPTVMQVISLICAVVLIVAIMPTSNAASSIYVNNANSTLSTDIQNSYAIGKSGVGLISTNNVYVMTKNGMQTLNTTTGEGNGNNQTNVSTVIDKSKYVDGSKYNNSPVTINTVKIGLYYNSTALSQAKLLNEVGSGYYFGYYDSSRNFQKLAYTDETALTMIKDTNVNVDGVGVVGCYHILLNDTYSDFTTAKNEASKYSNGFPAYYNGTYRVLVGQYTSKSAATEAISGLGISGTAYSASQYCVVVTKSNTNQIIFEFDCGLDKSLGICPRSNADVKSQTWFKGYKYYGGFQYSRLSGGDMTVVNILNIEDYVKGVIPYEMSSSWPLEALKAQALCARTYVASNLNQYKKYGFDVTNDTYSQVYRGTSSANATTNKAVDETAGLFIRYEGKLCSTFYFSSDGGSTEASQNVFSNALPYLVGVIDPFEQAIDFKYKTWSYTFTGDELATKLKNKGYSIRTVTDITPTYSDTGNCIEIVYKDSAGNTVTNKKTSVYNNIGLPSCHFTLTKSGSSYTFTGGGWGHNLGMSQWGAYSMAKVYGYNCEDIIRFYYTGAYIA